MLQFNTLTNPFLPIEIIVINRSNKSLFVSLYVLCMDQQYFWGHVCKTASLQLLEPKIVWSCGVLDYSFWLWAIPSLMWPSTMGEVTFSCQIKNHRYHFSFILGQTAKFNSHQFFRLYANAAWCSDQGLQKILVTSNLGRLSSWCHTYSLQAITLMTITTVLATQHESLITTCGAIYISFNYI